MLPLAVEEGLCHLVTEACDPVDRHEERAARLLMAMVALGRTKLSVRYDGEGHDFPTMTLGLSYLNAVDPREVLAMGPAQASSHEDRSTSDVRGIGFLLAKELVRRKTWRGLLDECIERTRADEPFEVEELLAEAELHSAADWHRALLDATEEESTAALADYSAALSGRMIASIIGLGGKASSADEWLEVGRPRIGLGGSDHFVPVTDAPELVAAIREYWPSPPERGSLESEQAP